MSNLPFDPHLPNQETLEAFKESDENTPSLKKFDSVEDFKTSLKID